MIELLVAMAIVAMILAISFPSFTAGLDGIRLRTAGQKVGAFVNVAKMRAERDQAPVEIVIDPAANRISAVSADGRWERSLPLEEGVRIAAVLPAVQPDDAAARRFVLIPGVPAPRFRIQLRTDRGRSLWTGIDPLTGVPQIEESS